MKLSKLILKMIFENRSPAQAVENICQILEDEVRL